MGYQLECLRCCGFRQAVKAPKSPRRRHLFPWEPGCQSILNYWIQEFGALLQPLYFGGKVKRPRDACAQKRPHTPSPGSPLSPWQMDFMNRTWEMVWGLMKLYIVSVDTVGKTIPVACLFILLATLRSVRAPYWHVLNADESFPRQSFSKKETRVSKNSMALFLFSPLSLCPSLPLYLFLCTL